MTRLSELVSEAFAGELRRAIDRGAFPGVSFRQAMEFLISDGILPESDLPLRSFLALEDWAREYERLQVARGGAPKPR